MKLEFDTLRTLVYTDPTYQVFTRDYYDQQFQNYFHIALKEKKPITVAVFDMDLFTDFNDNNTYGGHKLGDSVLQLISYNMRESLRKQLESVNRLVPEESRSHVDGLVAKYGGEEFVVLLVGGTEALNQGIIKSVFNSIRSTSRMIAGMTAATTPIRINDIAFDQLQRSTSAHQISASAGIAFIPHNKLGLTPTQAADPQKLQNHLESLFIRADEALKQAKKNGRDQLVIAKATGDPDVFAYNKIHNGPDRIVYSDDVVVKVPVYKVPDESLPLGITVYRTKDANEVPLAQAHLVRRTESGVKSAPTLEELDKR